MPTGQAQKKIAVLIGTRPEAIKLMPVIRALKRAGSEPATFVTGQHRELLTPILAELEIVATKNLDLMEDDQSLILLSSRILTGMRDLFRSYRPDLVVVQGDTTTVALGALACFYENVTVAHVEAGLRTHDRTNPFPEEMNRKLLACLAAIHFAPTARARENLLDEGVPADSIHVVGNTVIDALFHAREQLVGRLRPDPEIEKLGTARRAIVLVTGHRRESFGADLTAICAAIRDLASALTDRVEIFYPVHLNPNVQSVVHETLSQIPNVRLTQPLPYLRFLELMLHSKLIITDSGGVQEEAASLGIPILVTRRTCERLEAVDAGVSELVGPDRERIFKTAYRLLTDDSAYRARAVPTDSFGDGHAAERIVEILLRNPA
jgi:UDP-N-acetylglucosamine 2-epimerase (non-hydrolysing)